jgi:hypothetical protein
LILGDFLRVLSFAEVGDRQIGDRDVGVSRESYINV